MGFTNLLTATPAPITVPTALMANGMARIRTAAGFGVAFVATLRNRVGEDVVPDGEGWGLGSIAGADGPKGPGDAWAVACCGPSNKATSVRSAMTAWTSRCQTLSFSSMFTEFPPSPIPIWNRYTCVYTIVKSSVYTFCRRGCGMTTGDRFQVRGFH